jgi:predicted RNase H-like HicB family nuclease
MRYAAIFEKTDTGYSAYAPDVPGCAAVGDTLEETKQQLASALAVHFEGTQEDGDPIPEPTSVCDYVDVELPAPKKVTRPSRRRKQVS